MNSYSFIFTAFFWLLIGCTNSNLRSEVSAQQASKSYQSTQESIQWIRPVLERKALFSSREQAAFEATYRLQNKTELLNRLSAMYGAFSSEQISDLQRILSFEWPQMAKRNPDEKDHEWLASELLMTKRWDSKSEREAAALLWPSVDSIGLSLDQTLGLRALEAIQLMKKSVPQIKDEDRAIVARNWSDGKAFVWSRSSIGTKPELLSPFLQAGFDRTEEATVMTIHSFNFPSPDLKISEQISLVRADWISIPLSFYEADKSKLNIEREKSAEPFVEFYESVGFVVLKSAQGECSIPFFGQSNQGSMVWILGAEANQDSRPSVSNLKFNLNGLSTSIGVVGRADSLCAFQSTQPGDWRAKAELAKDFVGNYSVFRFQGAILKDPFVRSPKSVALIAQRPNVRRGLDYACALPEEKNWLLVGREQSGQYQMNGGRIAIEPHKHESGFEVTALAGAQFVLNPQSIRESSISVYMPGQAQAAKTLGFDEIPKDLTKSPEFVSWLARQIKNDPY